MFTFNKTDFKIVASHRQGAEAVSATLTRGEALDAIDACATLEEATDLYREWIGHDEHGKESLEDLADMLRDYVADCCTSDDERSNGPQDSDDTGLPA